MFACKNRLRYTRERDSHSLEVIQFVFFNPLPRLAAEELVEERVAGVHRGVVSAQELVEEPDRYLLTRSTREGCKMIKCP